MVTNFIQFHSRAEARRIIGWLLFDFSNSITAVIAALYFSRLYISELEATNEQLNYLFIAAATVTVLTGWKIGIRMDAGKLSQWATLSCVIVVVSFFGIAIFSQLGVNAPYKALVGLIFVVYLYFYQIGRIAHNTFLFRHLPSEWHEKLSGFGAAANWIGTIFGLLVSLLVIRTSSESTSSAIVIFWGGCIATILLMIALLLMFNNLTTYSGTRAALRTDSIKSLSQKQLLLYFLTFFILFDALSTIQRNIPPYLIEVLHFSESKQAAVYVITIFSACVGGLSCVLFLNQRNSNMAVSAAAFCLAVAISILVFSGAENYWIVVVPAGISYGVLEAAMRVSFMQGINSKDAGRQFGLYTVIDRTSGIAAPIIWVSSFSLFDQVGTSYCMGFLLMVVLLLLAISLLQRMDSLKPAPR